jgi:hypothetical protein
MHAETLVEQEIKTNAKLRLFSLYVDFEAAICTRWAIGTITKQISPRWKTSSEMWALDFFQCDQPLSRMMLQGAADADVLIVALSSLAQRESKLIEWLNTLAKQKAERPDSGLFIGLLGDEDHEAGELEWTVKHFIRCAQKMGRDFIWQWMGREAINDPAWLTDNVEKFLSRKQSLSTMAWLQETTVNVGQLPEAVWFAANRLPTTNLAAP